MVSQVVIYLLPSLAGSFFRGAQNVDQESITDSLVTFSTYSKMRLDGLSSSFYWYIEIMDICKLRVCEQQCGFTECM